MVSPRQARKSLVPPISLAKFFTWPYFRKMLTAFFAALPQMCLSSTHQYRFSFSPTHRREHGTFLRTPTAHLCHFDIPADFLILVNLQVSCCFSRTSTFSVHFYLSFPIASLAVFPGCPGLPPPLLCDGVNGSFQATPQSRTPPSRPKLPFHILSSSPSRGSSVGCIPPGSSRIFYLALKFWPHKSEFFQKSRPQLCLSSL